ncbi:MAG: helix-turn-helix transcriptional regulator [Acidimicrobiales bacterium]
MDTPVAELSPTQRSVLVTLKRLGEATADELATRLGISSSAVRQHLAALRSAGFIAAQRGRGQPGRPADHYRVTEAAEPLFAPHDSRLSIEILEQVEAEDPELVCRIFDRRREQLVERARERLAGRSIDERIDAVTALLDEQGYLADFEKVDHGQYRIYLHSCAIWAVASRYRHACSAELDFIHDLLPDAAVDRVSHKTDGGHTCAYRISFEVRDERLTKESVTDA